MYHVFKPTAQIPEPGDYCQFHEFDAEVIEFDEENELVYLNVFYAEDYERCECIPYRSSDWLM